MSLLRRKTNADVVVFFDEEYTTPDGNIGLRPSTVGVPTRAEIQVAAQSGTSARRAEQDNEGYESEQTYRLRFPRSWDDRQPMMGEAAQVEWQGVRWSVIGFARQYNGSRRTRHIDYQIRRS